MDSKFNKFVKKFKAFMKEKWHVVLYFFFLISMAVGLVVMSNKEVQDTFSASSGIDFSEGWTYEFGDGVSGTTNLPGVLPKSTSKYLFLTNTLPDMDTDVHLLFKANHTFVRVFVGGVLKYDSISEVEDLDKWYLLQGINYVQVSIKDEDAGKDIVIESYTTEGKYLSKPGTVYLGNRGDFFINIIRNRMKTFVCCILLAIISIMLIGFWVVCRLVLKMQAKELICLALFTATVDAWLLTECQISQFFGFGAKTLTILAYESLILIPVPIALYFFYASARKAGKRASAIVATVPLIVFLVVNLLHLFHIMPLTDSLIITQVMLGLEIVVVSAIQVVELSYISKLEDKKYGRNRRIPLYGICLFVPLALIEVIKYAVSSNSYSNDGILVSVGIVIYICSLALDSIVRSTYKNVKLQASVKSNTQFLANMSHEIRTPLNAILGFNEAILQNTEDQKVRKYAVNIHDAGENLKDIINSILDITKIEMGELEICTVEYSTLQLLDNITSMMEVLASKKNLTLITDIDPNLPEILIGDEQHLRQILINILNNAVKYTDVGTVTLTVKVVAMPEDSPMCRILFSIKDTGHGIKEEDIDKLFKKFERLNQDKYSNTEGTGLGMSIVLQTLKAMNSEIMVESEYGVGSNFYFELEQCVVNRESIGDFLERRKDVAIKNYQGMDFSAPDAHILIVDDVQMNLDAVSALLEFTHIKIDTATSGDQAIELVKNKHYDMIFMDHMMPGTDGIKATQIIREYSVEADDPYYAMVPIIALTANTMVGMKEIYQQSGMQDLVSKPVELAAILKSIRTWLPKELIQKVDVSLIDTEKAGDDDWNIKIEGINIEEAKKYNINVEGFIRNLTSFVMNYSGNRAEIEKLAEAREANDYTVKVHGLKSTSKMIGAMELSEKNLELEKMGNEGNVSRTQTREMLELYDACVDSIKSYLENNQPADDEGPAPLNDEEFDELMKKVLSAADEFDAGAFMQLGDELSEIRVDSDKKELFEQVRILVDNMSFGEISKLLKDRY